MFVVVGSGEFVGEDSKLYVGKIGEPEFDSVGSFYLCVDEGDVIEHRMALFTALFDESSPRRGMSDDTRSAVVQIVENRKIGMFYKPFLADSSLYTELTALDLIGGMDVVFRVDDDKLTAHWSPTAPVHSADPAQRPVRYRMVD